MFAYHLVPTSARLRVQHGDHVLVDTRRAKIGFIDGRAPFYLLSPSDIDASLVARSETTADFGERHDVVLPDGTTLTRPATVYPARDGWVRLDPRDAYAEQLVWNPDDEELVWHEEGRPTFPYARHPRHRVDALPLSQPGRIELVGTVVADSTRAVLVRETSSGPRVYVPARDFAPGVLVAVDRGTTVCPYKGVASYFDLRAPGGRTLPRAAWAYDRDTAPQNWLLPELSGLRAVAPGPGLAVFVGDTRLDAPTRRHRQRAELPPAIRV